MVLVAALSVTGCGAQVSEGDSGVAPAGYPVTVTNCGQPLSVRKPPSRVVTNDIGITELMFALGLDDRMAGYVVDKGQSGGVASSPWKADFTKVPKLAEKQPRSRAERRRRPGVRGLELRLLREHRLHPRHAHAARHPAIS
ncbi:hypothetical protein [Amycolatopsis sp. DSM 110486]|uniref:hypothetical protein n=1 Tax=Amycolatopsis sp. DSM 110486 TaxID=2865832 RepID=UPI0021036717|nr:hypothetical protein [Amycolatopsis sp. DSM 110486]